MKNKRKSQLKHMSDSVMRETLTDVNESFYMEMNSDGELSFRGCRRIKDYRPDTIFLISDDYFITLNGKELYLKNYSEEQTAVGGTIENISLLKREGKKNVQKKT